MNILAFDCSTETLCLGVQAGAARHTEAVEGGAATSSVLLPRARSCCAALGLSLDQLDAIAFGQGPGAFTGVRAACAAAQGLAYGLGKPVIEVPTLEIVARDALARLPASTRHLCIAMDARMGEVYVTSFKIDSKLLSVDADVFVVFPENWKLQHAELLALETTWVAGNARTAHAGLASLARWCDAAPTADALLDAALARAATQSWVPAALAAPLYVRNRVALTTRERLAGETLGAAS
jgi:tRNA threonylcarbamoyladenosine biosynthesis protein TsaB